MPAITVSVFRFLAAVLVSLVWLVPARAEVIALKRGLPTDIWLTWPEGERFDEPGLLKVFPEYRQAFKGGEFKLAKDSGFDFIRLTIDPAMFLWKRSPARTSQLLKGVAAAVDEIRANDLKVVVDLHSIPHLALSPGTEQLMADPTLFEVYLGVVGDVGKLLQSYPASDVAFEPLNEPTADCDTPRGPNAVWPGLLQRLHDAARAAAPQTTLILSGACWGGAEGLAAVNPAALKDDNVIWSFHSYDPFLFSHQGASWTDDEARYIEGLSFPPVRGTQAMVLKASLARLAAANLPAPRKKELKSQIKRDVAWYYEGSNAVTKAREPFRIVDRWARRNHIPPTRILLGEFGAIRGDESKPLSDKARAPLISLIRHQAEARGWAWSCWSWSGSFGISAEPSGRSFSPVLRAALFGK